MKLDDRNKKLRVGLLLMISTFIVYYFLLVYMPRDIDSLFSGAEVIELPIQTIILKNLTNFWWSFCFIIMAGIIAVYFNKNKLGSILYIIPAALFPIVSILVVWGMYSAIFILGE